MKNRRIDNTFKGTKENLSKDSISYRDIGFILESQKQYMTFFANLDRELDGDIDESFIIAEIASAYIEYRNNMNKGYEQFKEAKEDTTQEEKKDIFESIISRNLQILGNIMKKSGALEFWKRKHNRKYSEIDESLEVSKEQIESEFEEKRLSRKNIIELTSLSAFWTNKFIKYIDNIEEYYMYVLDTQGLTSSKDSHEEDRRLYVSLQKKHTVEKIFLEANSEEEAEGIIKEYKEEYKKVFEAEECKRVSLRDDYSELKIFELMKQQLYVAKNMAIKEILVDRISDIYSRNPIQKIKTWGIQDDEKDKTKTIVTIELPGYMLPISVHIPKMHIRELLEKNNISKIDLPQYKPEEDFLDKNGRYLGANVMVMATEQQEKAIRKAYKINKKNKTLGHIKRQIAGETQKIETQTITMNAEER